MAEAERVRFDTGATGWLIGTGRADFAVSRLPDGVCCGAGATSAPHRSASGKPHETGTPESMIRATEEA